MKKNVSSNESIVARRRFDDREQMLDKRSVLIGLGIVLCLFIGATAWKLAVAPEKKQLKLRVLEFTTEAPIIEKPEIKDPQRPMIKPLVNDMPEMEDEQRPDIQMSTNPQEVEFQNDVIKTTTMEMPTEVDVRVAKLNIQDNMEIAEVVDKDIVDAKDPIAVFVNEPADIFTRPEPDPNMRRKVAMISTAPRVSTTMKVSPPQIGDQEVPTGGELGPVDINIFGDGDSFSGLKRGGFEMRTAVDAALQWLALHQEPDGSWIMNKWKEEDAPFETPPSDKPPPKPSTKPGANKQEAKVASEGSCAMTSFALLAFMGGGHNLHRGEHKTTVIRGVEWLLSQQDQKTGYVGSYRYNHPIATIALCETLGRSPDERIGLAARKAVEACVAGVNSDGGWRYVPNDSTSDMSVTGWFLQALKTAKLANIRFDNSVFSRGLTFVDQVTDKAGMSDSSGAVGYTVNPVNDAPVEENAPKDTRNLRPALTCAGMVIRQFNGLGVQHPLLTRGAELTRKQPPDWQRKDFYYWYYATYAMHNMGGENRLWWNRRIRDTLLEHQSKRGHQAGSWNPQGDKCGSRVFTTSMGALCLEVYDRYGEALQSFGTVPSVEDLFFRKQ